MMTINLTRLLAGPRGAEQFANPKHNIRAMAALILGMTASCGAPQNPAFRENILEAKNRGSLGSEELSAEALAAAIKYANTQTEKLSNSEESGNLPNSAAGHSTQGFPAGAQGQAGTINYGTMVATSPIDGSFDANSGTEMPPAWNYPNSASTSIAVSAPNTQGAATGAASGAATGATIPPSNNGAIQASGPGSASTPIIGSINYPSSSGAPGTSTSGAPGTSTSGAPGTSTSGASATTPVVNSGPVASSVTTSQPATNSGSTAATPTGQILLPSQLRTQTFIQPEKRPVDLLWIVDTSGSMEEEQTYLAANFQSFITTLKNTGIHFQTAITSTDVCDPSGAYTQMCPANYGGSSKTNLRGSFVGSSGRKILKDTDSDLISRFTSYTNLGINGSGFEHGLTAATMAITKSLNGQNEPLIRQEAFLSIIVVSDEEDDGIGLSMDDENGYNFTQLGLTSYKYSHKDFISQVNKLKGAGNFAVNAITGTRNPDGSLCTSPHSKPYEEGTQYINAAKETGGLVQSICETNWSKSLANIGQDINAQISQIALEKQPIANSVIVEINGIQTNQWQYIGASNAIKFLANAIPPPGSLIKVTYSAAP